MISPVKLYKHLKRYGIAYLLILAHFPGGIIANIAILVSSVWAFSYFIIKKKLDLYLIFLLLLPAIAIGISETTDSISTGSYLSRFQSVFIIGPLALSTRLALALAVPLRLIVHFTKLRFYSLTLFWLITVFLAIFGLLLAVSMGSENPAGLTVGFRIALSIGAALIPLCVEDKKAFYRSLDSIFFASIVLVFLGLLTGHWIFITTGFIPYILKRTNSKILVVLILIFSAKLLIGLEATITILGILLISFLFYFIIQNSNFCRKILSKQYIYLIIILAPIYLTIYTIRLPENKTEYDITTIQGLARFKLIGDRKPIWDASYEQIITSPFFVVPAGSSLIVYFDYLNQWQYWEPGAHNIFLEMGRQIGGMGMLILTFIMIYILYKAGGVSKNKDDLILYYSFISVYIIFGLTGNSLVYDGVGFFFWFLVGQYYRTGFSENLKSSDGTIPES